MAKAGQCNLHHVITSPDSFATWVAAINLCA